MISEKAGDLAAIRNSLKIAVAGFSKAARIATVKSIGKSVFGGSKATLNLILHAYSNEGIILSATIGLSAGLIDRIGTAYNILTWNTTKCSQPSILFGYRYNPEKVTERQGLCLVTSKHHISSVFLTSPQLSLGPFSSILGSVGSSICEYPLWSRSDPF